MALVLIRHIVWVLERYSVWEWEESTRVKYETSSGQEIDFVQAMATDGLLCRRGAGWSYVICVAF